MRASEEIVERTRRPSRTMRLARLAALLMATGWLAAAADGVYQYLSIEQAPRVIFPEADVFERNDLPVDDAMRRRMKKVIGRAKPSIWEPFYISFVAKKAGEIIGYAVICEEIGKHRPITFIVGTTPDGAVRDVALIAYREPIGGEVRDRRFLKQFQRKDLGQPIRQYHDIKNISGATLSVRAMSRGVRKALAVIQLAYLDGAPQGEDAQHGGDAQ